MKISNSKKQLARIISENDGWIAGDFAAQQDDGEVWFSVTKPIWKNRCGTFDMGYEGHFTIGHLVANRHQTILSRDEYLHLYPVAETAPEPVAEVKPTIDQLVADYKAKLTIAQQAQEEADSHRCGAEAALEKLVSAGKALGVVLSVAAPEPELVITDWRDLQIGDIIEYVDGDIKDKIGMTGPVVEFAPDATDGMYVRLECDNGPNKGLLGWPRKFRFIRRP